MTGACVATREELGLHLGVWEIFQQPRFLELYARHYGWSVVTHNGLNIFARKVPGLGLIRTQIYGPEAAGGADWHLLLEDLPAGRIEVMTNAPVPMSVARPVSPSDLYSFVIDLRQGAHCLFASFDSGVRKAIRRAERENLTVRLTKDGCDVVEFYRVVQRVTRGGTVYNAPDLALLRAIMGAGFARLYVMEHGGQIVGGVFILVNRYSHGYLSVYDRDACNGLPGNVLYWAVMKGEIDAGIPFLDLGAQSAAMQGLTLAKNKYSPRLVPAYRYELAPSRWRATVADGWRWLKRPKLQAPLAPTKPMAEPD